MTEQVNNHTNLTNSLVGRGHEGGCGGNEEGEEEEGTHLGKFVGWVVESRVYSELCVVEANGGRGEEIDTTTYVL